VRALRRFCQSIADNSIIGGQLRIDAYTYGYIAFGATWKNVGKGVVIVYRCKLKCLEQDFEVRLERTDAYEPAMG
jgi:hypothetical protein